MVIIKCTAHINARDAECLVAAIHEQAKTGVIVLPHICELLSEVPADEEIQVIYQDARVAELEAELATAMAYISKVKDCETCKQYEKALSTCDTVCSECKKEACFCRDCYDGSKWEWRAARGR